MRTWSARCPTLAREGLRKEELGQWWQIHANSMEMDVKRHQPRGQQSKRRPGTRESSTWTAGEGAWLRCWRASRETAATPVTEERCVRQQGLAMQQGRDDALVCAREGGLEAIWSSERWWRRERGWCYLRNVQRDEGPREKTEGQSQSFGAHRKAGAFLGSLPSTLQCCGSQGVGHKGWRCWGHVGLTDGGDWSL